MSDERPAASHLTPDLEPDGSIPRSSEPIIIRRSASQNWAIGLLVVAAIGMGLTWSTLDAYEARAAMAAEQKSVTTSVPQIPLLLEGQTVGWFDLSFPSVLPHGEDGALKATYRVAPSAAGADSPWASPTSRRSNPDSSEEAAFEVDRPMLTVSFTTARLKFGSDPSSYKFDNRRLLSEGIDAKTWIFAPPEPGTYKIAVRIAAAPAEYQVNRVDAEYLFDDGTYVLPIRVTTSHGLSKSQADMMKLAASGVWSLLAVPFAGLLWKKFEQRIDAKPRKSQKSKKNSTK